MVASVKVFKKTSPNAKLTVYLGKRDFVDHQDHVDPIEGVVVADPDYLKGRKVFCQVNQFFLFYNQSKTEYSILCITSSLLKGDRDHPLRS